MKRFGEGLPRIAGEVSRPHLWSRAIEYLSGGSGPGSLVYGGVGVNRFVLDYEKPGHQPFADVFRRPRKFRFFVPKAEDLKHSPGGDPQLRQTAFIRRS